MQAFAKAHALPFPYLHNNDQAAAQAMGRSARPIFSATMPSDG